MPPPKCILDSVSPLLLLPRCAWSTKHVDVPFYLQICDCNLWLLCYFLDGFRLVKRHGRNEFRNFFIVVDLLINCLDFGDGGFGVKSEFLFESVAVGTTRLLMANPSLARGNIELHLRLFYLSSLCLLGALCLCGDHRAYRFKTLNSWSFCID